jgi:hypothetical protein
MNLKDEKIIFISLVIEHLEVDLKKTTTDLFKEERQLVKILTIEGSDHLEGWDGKVHGLRVNGRILV